MFRAPTRANKKMTKWNFSENPKCSFGLKMQNEPKSIGDTIPVVSCIFEDMFYIPVKYFYILMVVKEIMLTLKNVNSDQILGLVRCLSVWPLPC